MDFFSSCKSESERKETYHKLAKAFHPDRGGDAGLMQELNKQYENPNSQSNINQGGIYHSYFQNVYQRSHRTSDIDNYNRIIADKNAQIMSLTNSVNILNQKLEDLDSFHKEEKNYYYGLESNNQMLRKEINELKEKLKEAENKTILDNIKTYFKGKDAEQS